MKRALALLGVAACGPRGAARPAPADPDRIAIVVSERGPHGARLVAIDERGDRHFVAVAPPADGSAARDTNPAISPDGRFVVFASSRGRASGTSLWIAALGVEQPAARLTAGDAIETHPAWSPDGRSVVFASTRDGGDFDLWRVAIANGAPGAAEQLTHGDGHEVTPSVAADGAIVYASVSQTSATEVESHLEERAPDGSIRRLTLGPADTAPALSPDGKAIAFARPVARDKAIDADLFVMPRAGGDARSIVDVPLTDETSPVWSRDGRFLFATSVLRGSHGEPAFAAVVAVDLRESPVRARMLEDRAGAVERLTPAIGVAPLDAAWLRADPEYLPELGRIVRRAIEEQAP